MQDIKEIAVVGHLSIDTIKVNDKTYPNLIGGAVLYSAFALSTNNSNVHMISTLCDDFDNNIFLNDKPKNVYSNQIIHILGNQRRAFMEYSKQFERTSHNHARKEWLKDTISQSPRQLPIRTINYDAVMLVPMLPEVQLQYINWFKVNTKAMICLDTSEYFAENCREELIEIIKKVDIFIPSNVELDYLFPENHKDIYLHIKTLLNLGLDKFVIKMSTFGSVIVESGNSINWCNIRETNAIDTTGAGDSFAGSFISRYLISKNLIEAVKYATVVSSLCVEKLSYKGLLNIQNVFIEEEMNKLKIREEII